MALHQNRLQHRCIEALLGQKEAVEGEKLDEKRSHDIAKLFELETVLRADEVDRKRSKQKKMAVYMQSVACQTTPSTSFITPACWCRLICFRRGHSLWLKCGLTALKFECTSLCLLTSFSHFTRVTFYTLRVLLLFFPDPPHKRFRHRESLSPDAVELVGTIFLTAKIITTDPFSLYPCFENNIS